MWFLFERDQLDLSLCVCAYSGGSRITQTEIWAANPPGEDENLLFDRQDVCKIDGMLSGSADSALLAFVSICLFIIDDSFICLFCCCAFFK